jgi:hypothetical protein
MVKGDTIADLTVIKHGLPDPYGLYQCWDCSRGFRHDYRAVIVTYSGNPNETDAAEILAMHLECAEEYRKRHVPIVVTVHPDGTASVTGPGDVGSRGKTVTVVIEAK